MTSSIIKFPTKQRPTGWKALSNTLNIECEGRTIHSIPSTTALPQLLAGRDGRDLFWEVSDASFPEMIRSTSGALTMISAWIPMEKIYAASSKQCTCSCSANPPPNSSVPPRLTHPPLIVEILPIIRGSENLGYLLYIFGLLIWSRWKWDRGDVACNESHPTDHSGVGELVVIHFLSLCGLCTTTFIYLLEEASKSDRFR